MTLYELQRSRQYCFYLISKIARNRQRDLEKYVEPVPLKEFSALCG